MQQLGTILLADDAETSRRILERSLSQAGYTVLAARNGVEVLEIVAQQPIDLVLLDVIMPELDGYATLRRLRLHHSLTQLPIIMLTALSKGDSVIEALRLGANDYAVKPVEFSVLLERIATHLKLKRPSHRQLGKYTLVEQIGSGSMGLVFAATEFQTERRVAMKILPRALTVQLDCVQRFRREAALLARISHPHVVGFYGAGQDGETHYMVMELVEGASLHELALGKPVAPPVALELARQAVLGLAELTKHGIIHRDIKPSNLLLSRDSGLLKIADFGVARDVTGEGMRTQAGMVVGSLMFSSPEQLDGETDMFSDMYSLGCTLFFLLSGKLPFPDDKSLAWFVEQKAKRPPSLGDAHPGCPKSLVKLVANLMAPKPSKRAPSYEALLATLEALQAGMGPEPLPTLTDYFALGGPAAT